MIRDRDEANQWYTGECDGREGSFPADHVELLPGDSPPTAAPGTGVGPSQAAAALSSTAATARQRNLTLKKTSAIEDDGASPAPVATPRELPSVPSTLRGDVSKFSYVTPCPLLYSLVLTYCSGEMLQAFAKNKFRKVPAKKTKGGDGTQVIISPSSQRDT